MIELLSEHTWLLLVGIFVARIADQTLDTLRLISTIRGYMLLAALCGFVEVLIWINVAGQVIRHLDTWYLAVVYAAGFATGNTVGIWLEGRLAMGYQMVRVFSQQQSHLAERLWEKHYPATQFEGQSKSGTIDLVIVAQPRKKIADLCKLIGELDPEAFYTIEDIKRIGSQHLLHTNAPRRFMDIFGERK